MNSMTVSLVIAAIMAILFLSAKFPYGLITMACTVALVLTGILSMEDAFTGFTNTNVILMATMFTMTAALQKTNVPIMVSKLITKAQGKSNLVLVAVIVFAFMTMNTVIPDTVCIALVVSFLMVLPKDGDVTATKMIIPLLMLIGGWYMLVPIGMGATSDFMPNAFMEGVGVASNQLFHYGDMARIRIPVAIVTVLYVLFIWKKIPDSKAEIDMGSVSANSLQESQLPKWKQYLVYGSFVVVILGLIFNSRIGNLGFILPATAACVFGFTGILNQKELIKSLTSDTIWMMVGVLAVTGTMTVTGATAFLGNMLLPLISWTDNGFLIVLICCSFSAVMTTFLSSMGTASVLVPLVSSMALSAGYDPRSLAAAVSIGALYAICFPSGSVTCALAYSMGKYNPVKVLKYTFPLLILLVLVTSISISIIFPPI